MDRRTLDRNTKIALTIHSADVIAECMPVSTETYKYLWNVIIPKMEAGECGEYGDTSISVFWKDIPEAIQLDIVQGIKEQQAEYDAICGEI